MEQDDGSEPTAWFQPPITTTRRRNPPIEPVILILLPILFLLLLFFFFLHSLQSHIPKTIKPTFLKSTWDLLNVFLVFFAIICGVFASTNNGTKSMADATNPVNNLMPESYEYQEHVQVNGGLRRSSRSYPDLRRESESLREKGENGIRFSDDSGVDIQNSSSVNNRSPRRGGGKEDTYRSETISGDIRHRPRRWEAKEVHVEGSTKLSRNVPVSMVQLRPLSPPAPSPVQPLSVSVKTRRRRSSRSLGRDETVAVTSRIDKIQKVSENPPSSTPPPPLPSLVPSEHRLRQKHDTLEGTLSESTSELATKIDSVDDQRKRKQKSRQKPTNIHPVTPSIQPPPPPPPTPPVTVAPPLPPLRSIFNAIFKTGRKTKHFPSKTSPPPSPPSPPPPPPSSIITGFFKTGTKSKHVNSSFAISPPRRSTVAVTLRQESTHVSQIKPPSPPLQRKPEAPRRRPVGTDKPPLPTKKGNFYDRDDFLPSGSHSPMIPIPPPSPPFMTPAMKFELRGDSGRVRSSHESVCSSPEHGPVDFRSPSTSTSTAIDVEDSFGPSPISFPSPDVNVKADSFISRRKDEWRMENIKFN